MKAIAVDDEIYMLETLQEAISASADIEMVEAFSSCSAALAYARENSVDIAFLDINMRGIGGLGLADIEMVEAFSSCSAALAYARENPVDIAFLDINMRGIGGLGLAEKLLEQQPQCKIIFCTGYAEYAVSAFQLHVSGYLMKPITPEAVQKEIDHIKGVKATEKLLTIQCFGNFEVFYNGEILPLRRKKAKELLAILIDRNGAGMTAKQLCTILFPEDTDDTKNAAYLRQLVLDLKNTLKTIRAEDVLRHDTPYYRIDTNLVRCDYLSFLETGKPEFYGEYMTQYSWAESTCAMLQFKK